jgi:hypothetical protein
MSDAPRSGRRQISSERQTTYYLGMGLVVIGIGLFVSTFLSFGTASLGQMPSFGRPLAGMGMMVVGRLLMVLGARGPAGAGLILDPERARRDLEPMSRMGGGMLKDALDEANVDLGQDRRTPREVVKLRCRACGALDDETAKFCSACGKPM